MSDELPPLPEGFVLYQPEQKSEEQPASDLPPMPEGYQAQPVAQDAAEHPAEKAPQTGQDWRGDVAAGLRGMREAIPFARDIGAGAEYLRKNLMGDGTTFKEEKESQAARDAALAKEHPKSYLAGEVTGAVAPALLTGGESLLASGEGKVASKLGQMLGSEAEGKLAAGLGSGILGGAATGAAHGLGTGTDLEERLGHAGTEALEGGVAGGVGAGLGHLAARGARKIGEKLGQVEPIRKAMTSDELLESAKNAYKESEQFNAKVKAAEIRNLHDSIWSDLKGQDYNKIDNQRIKKIMNRLKDVNAPITLNELDKIRQSTKDVLKDFSKPHNQTLAMTIRDRIDDFMDDLHPNQMQLGASAVKPKEFLDEARSFYKQGKKLELIDEAMERAKNRAAVSGSGGNYNNALRQEIKKLYEKGSKYQKYWTPDEIKAMEETFKGGVLGNLARPISKLDPFHHGLIGAIELPHMLMHPKTGFMGPLAGMGAHKLASSLTHGAGENLKKIIASGGKKEDILHINPLESARARNVAVPASVAPIMTPEENRTIRASGGKVDKRDYPAKRLTRMEKALRRAQSALAEETKPIMEMPDHHVAHALEVAKEK